MIKPHLCCWPQRHPYIDEFDYTSFDELWDHFMRRLERENSSMRKN